jgi:hypothetical protein
LRPARRAKKNNQMFVSIEVEAKRAHELLKRRLKECALLCTPQLKDIASCWGMYLGRHEEVLRRRLSDLGAEFDDNLVRSILECLESAASNSWEEPITAQVEAQVFSLYAERSRSKDLRCELCGYHFLESDLGARRLSLASEYDFELARSVHPRREGDLLKPLSVERKDRYYTSLEIDHIRPRAALGRSTPDNLSIVCRLCNVGKADFMHPLEGLSVSVASSLGASYSTPKSWHSIVTVVAAFQRADGACERTGNRNVELTVLPRDGVSWFMPWNLEVVSYDAMPED